MAYGVELCKRVNSPRVKILYDMYHVQIMEGDIIRMMRENIQYIGHFHTAGNPGPPRDGRHAGDELSRHREGDRRHGLSTASSRTSTRHCAIR